VTRWGTYYQKPYQEWKNRAVEWFKKVEQMDPLMEGPLAVQLWAGVKPAKTTKLPFPRGDGDNFEKAVYDCITKSGKVWHDDNQVVTGHWIKYFEEDFPGVRVEIHELGRIYDARRLCEVWLF
jgi:Holliday junction resolvase RusA-like endonuclease